MDLRMLTVDEAASEVGVSIRTIQYWMAAKGLPFHVWYKGRGNVQRRINAGDLAEFLFNGPMPRFHASGCDDRACSVYRWRQQNSRKANAAMRASQRAHKHADEPGSKLAKQYPTNSDHGAAISEPGAATDDQVTSNSDPDPSSK